VQPQPHSLAKLPAYLPQPFHWLWLQQTHASSVVSIHPHASLTASRYSNRYR